MVNDVSQFGIRHAEDDDIEGWQGIKSVEEEIKKIGRKALAIEADVSSSQQIEEMVTKCVAEFGHIDILVNNAGVTGPQRVEVLEVSEEEWNHVLAVNTTGVFLCARAVAGRMIEQGQGGKIINFSSIRGKISAAGWGPYIVSKFGVIGLTQTLALELAKYNIYVNAVCPGFIATEIGLGAGIRRNVRGGTSLEEATAGAYADILPQIPLGLAAQPEDVAKVVAFLASDESNYMTGQAINITGGVLMCH